MKKQIKIKIEYVAIESIKPYKNNPRDNEKAVNTVAKSISEFGFKVPIILDKNNEIVTGHTRIKAATKLGFKEVPTIRANELTADQIKALRIMDNKSGELATWDIKLLKAEFHKLEDTDVFDYTGFSPKQITNIWEKENPTIGDKDNYDEEPVESTKKLGSLVITCPNCKHKFKKAQKKSH